MKTVTRLLTERNMVWLKARTSKHFCFQIDQICCWAHPTLHLIGTGLFPRGKIGQRVKLTTTLSGGEGGL
jgi:hypothetical protein